MRGGGLGAIVLVMMMGGAAQAADPADWPNPENPGWYRQAQQWIESLLGDQKAGRDVIVPPAAEIDPQMALAPPEPRGTLRVIRPGEGAR